ncbi:hypothetical protein [Breoghania sp.]|uniref:hypothetical protein n=1 Tax=Breoghania sp. TaxID=2065378 RepID=UPI00260408C7|nr:hypothetical protein [Breoghania sp.]MDJ0930226.1 hypothetical protein [Breoghania sp.]
MNRVWGALREGTWVRAGLVRFAAVLAFVGSVGVFAAMILVPNAYQSPSGKTLLIYFLSFWSAAREAVAGMPAAPYDTVAFQAYQIAVTGDLEMFSSFLYPPTWLLVLVPVGTMAFVPAFILFSLVGLGLFAFAMRAVSGAWRIALPLLAAPMVLNTVLHG